MEKLVRVDRNGTKHFEDCCCEKCGGTGVIPVYNHVDGGRCFLCNGTGIHRRQWVVYTDEYKAKMAARRNAKAFADMGLGEDGIAYVVCGNTYEVKEVLKERGARYNWLLGWYFGNPRKDFDCVKVDCNKVFAVNFDKYGELDFDHCKDTAKADIKATKDAAFPPAPSKSEWLFNKGDKVKVEVVVKRYVTMYNEDFGESYLYIFEDDDKNVIVWKASRYNFDIEDALDNGKKVVLAGTVKGHDEYKGTKQTVLTRCKVVG